MPDRPSHPYGLDPAEELPALRTRGNRERADQGRRLSQYHDDDAYRAESPASTPAVAPVPASTSTAPAASGGPLTRRARREAENARLAAETAHRENRDGTAGEAAHRAGGSTSGVGGTTSHHTGSASDWADDITRRASGAADRAATDRAGEPRYDQSGDASRPGRSRESGYAAEGYTGTDRPADSSAWAPPGADPDRTGSDQSRTGAHQNRTGAHHNRTGSDANRTGAHQDRAGSDQEPAGAHANRTGDSSASSDRASSAEGSADDSRHPAGSTRRSTKDSRRAAEADGEQGGAAPFDTNPFTNNPSTTDLPITTPAPPSRSGRRARTGRGGWRPLNQIAAALGVLAVLGGVAVAADRFPDDTPAQTSAEAIAVTRIETEAAERVAPSANQAALTGPSVDAKLREAKKTVAKKVAQQKKAATSPVKKAKPAEDTKKADVARGPVRPAGSGGTGAADTVKLGVFRGTSPAEVTEFGQWLGRQVDYASDFSTRTTWDEIANPTQMLDTWKGSGYRMVYATALLPTQDPSATMAAGAQGEYDEYFTTLARNLVNAGQGDAILRLGWEFNLSAARWHPDTPDNFIAYWRHVVTAMRSVPGTDQLQFDWNPNIGGEVYNSTNYYPGNEYVDYVGVDTYDISWLPGAYPFPATCSKACQLKRQKTAWQNTLNGTFGLNFWADFAKSQGKPMSLPEWALWAQRPDGHGGGDNPYYIKQMHAFIDDPANNVAYQSYFEFDVNESGTHELTTLTTSGTAFRKLFTR